MTKIVYLIPFILLFLLKSCIPKETNLEAQFIDSLLKEMTIEEKIGQMNQICFSKITLGKNKELVLDTALFADAIKKYHVGSFLSGTGSAVEWKNFIYQMQKIAMEQTRLGIPLLIGIDHIHGANYVDEGTILPHNILLSCSFDTSLIAQSAKITASETAHLGLKWNFAPVLGLARNPYWPRFYETYGEDPFLTSRMGGVYIRNLQQKNSNNTYILAACAKHYLGYSAPASGWDRTPSLIPEQTLYEFFLPPFKNAINQGVLTIMANSGELNGEPMHASGYWMDSFLRDTLGFEGVLITDIKDIQKIVELHGGAKDINEATLMVLNAGFDVSMTCEGMDFLSIVKNLIDEKKISEERIDKSVKRILRLKYQLGLFSDPYPDLNSEPLSNQYFDVAHNMASESVVLLKNDGVLPLTSCNKILLAGFATNSKKNLNGAWTLEWLGAEDERHHPEMNTLLTALENEYGAGNILHAGRFEDSPEYSGKFKNQAKHADCILLTIGEEPYSEFKGNITSLELPSDQKKLIEMAVAANKPVIMILIEGRPRMITEFEPKLNAILFAGYPGIKGAEAITDIVSGKINPSGKLSFSYPMYCGYSTTYNHKKSEFYEPLYEFGHGLSYTSFEYTDLNISDSVVLASDKAITASITLKNTGLAAGKEIVLWFVEDKYGKLTRPVRALKHFEKVALQPGEQKTVNFTFTPADVLQYPDKRYSQIMEFGDFCISAGGYSRTVYFENPSAQ